MIAPDLDTAMARLQDTVQEASVILPFTGAGISTECGIPDFRSPGGIWTTNRPIPFDEFLASQEARNKSWRRRFAMADEFGHAKPGRGHRALASLYRAGKVPAVVTQTFCFGQAASAAAVLLAAGTKGKRFALPHARILLHQPYGGGGGQASDIELQAKEILRMRDLLNQMLATDTGQSAERLQKDTDRDFIMDAEEAKQYGIIDEVITSREAVGFAAAVGAA